MKDKVVITLYEGESPFHNLKEISLWTERLLKKIPDKYKYSAKFITDVDDFGMSLIKIIYEREETEWDREGYACYGFALHMNAMRDKIVKTEKTLELLNCEFTRLMEL